MFEIAIDFPSKIFGYLFGRVILSFDRDATHNFWYTFDADDNRNVSQYSATPRWSYSIFRLTPKIYSAYDLTIHAAAVYAYHRGHGRWVELEDSAETGFPGPLVRTNVLRFEEAYPPFHKQIIGAGNSVSISIPKIGVFRDSLTVEDALRLPSIELGEETFTSYAALATVLHINTQYLFFTCLVPEMTASHPEKSFFIHRPILYATNDKRAMLERAESDRTNLKELGIKERTIHYWRIS